MARMMSTVRSGPSRKACYLRFINRTSRKVNVVWIDHAGYAINYGTLDPSRHFDIYTYEGHPWMCEDSTTMTRMLLNKSKIFFPSPKEQEQLPVSDRVLRCYLPVLSNNENLQNGNDAAPNVKREIVEITIPVFPLLEISAEVVARTVRSKNAVDCLPIPKRLRVKLHPYFHP